MREKRAAIMRNILVCLGVILALCALLSPAWSQMYYPDYYQQSPYGQPEDQYQQYPTANLQYDPRDAEMILREQMARQRQNPRARVDQAPPQQQMYEDPYGHRISDEGQVQNVMGEARRIVSLVRNRNGKPFIFIDKRNFQFYLCDSNGRLLRIGPVAIGKGKTEHGAFETHAGVFPISKKVAVDDWIRPDWYFREENEPIPRRWEDRRVPGFFRYKLVFDGMKYIHYAEATGGRLTHGCIGLDWQDAEAVFHTLQVGSYCVVADQGFLTRLARGEFPVQRAASPKPEPTEAVAAKPDSVRTPSPAETTAAAGADDKPFRSLW
ncbi:MAG: L,D-transpeptidase [Desulfomonile tiedjei]|uniref:L,D-transpeptidase n=1 Tax=Desulfomonile tiedjei TaxID=2358 RepID=A0A9D6UYK9_9BACT|nr:L,D-transpeptidase [Desulfomonile tiedjei]